MPVAPTPPTKPTPPVAPALSPAGTHTSPEQQSAAPVVSPAASSQLNQPVNQEVSEAVKKIEEINKAFQGLTPKNKTGEQPAKPAPVSDKQNTNRSVPATAIGSTQSVAAQSAVPVAPILTKPKPSITTYIPFFVGVVVLVALVLAGMRLFNSKKQKPEPNNIDNEAESKPANPNGTKTEIIIGPSNLSPKGERNFEAKV